MAHELHCHCCAAMRHRYLTILGNRTPESWHNMLAHDVPKVSKGKGLEQVASYGHIKAIDGRYYEVSLRRTVDEGRLSIGINRVDDRGFRHAGLSLNLGAESDAMPCLRSLAADLVAIADREHKRAKSEAADGDSVGDTILEAMTQDEKEALFHALLKRQRAEAVKELAAEKKKASK